MDTTLERPVIEPTRLVAPEDPLMELRRLNPEYMKIVDGAKLYEKITLLRAYDIRTPYEEMCVQLVLDRIEPVQTTGNEEAKVRREMAELSIQGIEIDSPEQADLWDTKLREARAKDAEVVEIEKKRRDAAYQGELTKAPVKPSTPDINPDSLQTVSGLGVKSIAKLEASGIKTKKAFEALSFAQKKSILGPLVADKFKS